MNYITGSAAEKISYSEWEYIYNDMIHKEDQKRQKAETRKKRIAVYYIKQKLSGVAMLALGIITPLLLDGDATASLLFVPMGLYLMITHSKVMDFRR